ncbi:hypothetical protein PCASD_06651 [Puccinia coronata f. sp. avenae]|uniref:Uncharacterized protein n=1 Tax=Puccinia coronata f. sp. avenae TaxID=200324 RepID=A0A2N5UH12_9BASI|nr:hypothetical protein PCASD_06651 [Puccinia coronata f. sp. avenae]
MTDAKKATQTLATIPREDSPLEFETLQDSKNLKATTPHGQQPSATTEISEMRNPTYQPLSQDGEELEHEIKGIKSPPWIARIQELFSSPKMRMNKWNVEWLEEQLYQKDADKLSWEAVFDVDARLSQQSNGLKESGALHSIFKWWKARHEMTVQELETQLEKLDPTRLSKHTDFHASGLSEDTGTCLLDPVRRNTFAILYGPGGNGKSTVIRTLANTLRGASAPIPEQHITSKSSGLHSEIVEPLVSKRLLYCADVDLKNHSLNLGFVRSSTGQDKISTPMGEASVSCSVIIGSNSLPSYKEQDDWLTEAIMRRVIVLPMLVDALSIRGPELPDSEDAYITFALRCVHTRMNYEQPPLSSLAIMMTLLGSEWQHHMHLFCLDSCPRGGDTEVSMIEAMVILETLLGRSVEDVANKTRHGACQGTVFKLSTPLSPKFIMSQLTNQPSQSGNEPTYLSKDESGELVVEDGAWLSSAHIPSYTLVPEVFKDNTEYAKKISASNSAPMYGSRTLVVMYKGTEKCPYLPVERVRILGVTRKSSGPQAYGTNYMRIGIPEAVFEDICAKASRRLDLKNPAVEKVTKQGGFYLFTVTVPKLMKVHMLALEDGQETVIEVPDPSGIFLMGRDIMASCFFVLKAKYKGQPVSPENAVGYSLAFEPAILTLIEPCDDQLDSDLGSGVPSMSMSSLAPSTIKPNKALADMLSSLSI